MQLRRKPSEQAEVAAESMNDIMFFLMLFFLIISTLANPNVVKLALPTAAVSKQMTKQPIIISVRPKEGAIGTEAAPEYYIDKEVVTEEDLKKKLQADLQGVTDPTIVLRIDKSLTVKDLKGVLMIGQELKIKMVMASASGGGS
jgi:biopolymer transport protein ExbD